jgi:hypothetical protein
MDALCGDGRWTFLVTIIIGQDGGAGKPWFDTASYQGTGRDESVPVKQKMFFWEVSLSGPLSVSWNLCHVSLGDNT